MSRRLRMRAVSGRTMNLATVLLLLATAFGVAGTTSRATAAEKIADPALRSAPADRLDRLASQLRRSPLAVDPELDWVVDAERRRGIVRTLRAAEVPVLVAVVPQQTEDESGGDPARILLGLQRRVKRDALYVVVDADGRIDLSALGIDRDPAVPTGLGSPPDIPTPRPGETAGIFFDSVPGRLAQLVDYVDAAPQTGAPAPGVTRVTALPSLAYDDLGSADDDREGSTVGSTVVLAVLGAGIGLFIAHRVIGRDVRRETGRGTTGWWPAKRRTAEERSAARRARAERRERRSEDR